MTTSVVKDDSETLLTRIPESDSLDKFSHLNNFTSLDELMEYSERLLEEAARQPISDDAEIEITFPTMKYPPMKVVSKLDTFRFDISVIAAGFGLSCLPGGYASVMMFKRVA